MSLLVLAGQHSINSGTDSRGVNGHRERGIVTKHRAIHCFSGRRCPSGSGKRWALSTGLKYLNTQNRFYELQMSENMYMLFLSIFILLLASNAPAIICAEIYYKKSTIKTELAIVCIILQLLSCFLVLKMNKYPLTIDLFIFILFN